MEEWVLMVGFESKKLDELKVAQKEFKISYHTVATLKEMIEAVALNNCYLLVVVSLNNANDLSYIQSVRAISNVPILVLKEQYQKEEKMVAISMGADEYIQWPDTIQELYASCYALLRRYTVLNRHSYTPGNIILQGEVFVSDDYRKVFIHGKELQLTGREFEVFRLLVARPDRVFTYGQLFDMIWSDGRLATENSLHSFIRRIRRKLEAMPECGCYIENIHGVGYCFRLQKT